MAGRLRSTRAQSARVFSLSYLYTVEPSKAKKYTELPEELPETPAGHYGTPLIGGKLAGSEYEHNPQFATSRARALMVSKMLRTSPVLAMAENHITGRITAVQLRVKRGEGTSDEAAEAVEKWLGLGAHQDSGGRLGGGMSTDDLMRHLLSARIYGNCLMSESWKYDDDEGLYFCELHRRRQESFDAWITERNSERLVAVLQRSSFAATRHILPIGESLWIVNRDDLGWYNGVSEFRSIYSHWRSTQLRYRLEDLIANKYASPPVAAKLNLERFAKFANGPNSAPPTKEDFTNEIAHMSAKLAGLHSEEDGHILFPDYWDFTPRSITGNYDPTKLIESASHHERLMAEKLFVSWIQQGRTGSSTGSFAMVSEQSRVASDAVVDSLQWVLSALNRQTVRRFCKVNFAGLSPSEYPVVSFERGSITSPFWQTNPQAFAQFVQAGILTMGPEDERAIRLASDLPAPEEDDLPTAADRLAEKAGGRLKTGAGQREARNPSTSKKTKNKFVNRLIERDEQPEEQE